MNMDDYMTQSFVYSFHNVKSVVLSLLQSPPNFVGSFVAGTAVRSVGAPTNCIIFGRLRADFGALTGISLTPASGSGSILNRAELVNAMAQEYTQPDSFIAGGLELSDGAGMHAYILRVNGLFGTVLYGVRYRVRGNNRRALSTSSTTLASAAKGIVVVEDMMYILVEATGPTPIIANTTSFVAVLQSNAVTGAVTKQILLAARNGSLYCSQIVLSGTYLNLLCSMQSCTHLTSSMLVSIDRELSCQRRPDELVCIIEDTFVPETVPFVSSVLSMTTSKTDIETSRYAYSTNDRELSQRPSVAPTQMPSCHPSRRPSAQPSSSPTAGPSISPQPSSQPSSSGPTNTNKPTAKPTQRPSATPTKAPTVSPTARPTSSLTLRPSAVPTLKPSTSPSTAPTRSPTRAPSAKPSRAPTQRVTCAPTRGPSGSPTSFPTVAPTVVSIGSTISGLPGGELTIIIIGCVGGFIAFVWIVCCIYRIVQHLKRLVEKDKRRVLFMQASNEPAQLEYPVLQRMVGFFTTIKNNTPADSSNKADGVETTLAVTSPAYQGRGAYMEGPAVSEFLDLEANVLSTGKGSSGANRPALLTVQQDAVENDRSVSSVSNEGSQDESDDGDVVFSEESSNCSEYASSMQSEHSSANDSAIYTEANASEIDSSEASKVSYSEGNSENSKSEYSSSTSLVEDGQHDDSESGCDESDHSFCNSGSPNEEGNYYSYQDNNVKRNEDSTYSGDSDSQKSYQLHSSDSSRAYDNNETYRDGDDSNDSEYGEEGELSSQARRSTNDVESAGDNIIGSDVHKMEERIAGSGDIL